MKVMSDFLVDYSRVLVNLLYNSFSEENPLV